MSPPKLARATYFEVQMKITYLKSVSPITESTKVSASTKEFVEKQLQDPKYRNLKKQLLPHFPELVDFSIEEHIGKNLSDIPLFQSDQMKSLFNFLPDCNLANGSISTVQDNAYALLLFNFVVDVGSLEPLDTKLFAFRHGKDQILNTVTSYPNQKLSAILMPLSTSKAEFLNWVDENWHKIEEANNNLPKFNATYLPKNLEVGEEIANMIGEGKSFSKISLLLSDKYPNDDRFKSEDTLKKIYKRYSKHLIEAITVSVAIKSLE